MIFVIGPTFPSSAARRARVKEFVARRRAGHRARTLAAALSMAGIEREGDRRPHPGTALSEPVVVVEGVHRSVYALYDRDDRPLGLAGPTDRCAPDYRALYELLAPDRSRILAMHIAPRTGGHADVILAADDAELVRLLPMDARGEPRKARLPRPARLGFRPRSLISEDERVGGVRRSRHGGLAMLIVTDGRGAEAARVVRVLGGAAAGGTERRFVVDVRDDADDRIRAVALLVGVLWDWSIVSWDPGGG